MHAVCLDGVKHMWIEVWILEHFKCYIILLTKNCDVQGVAVLGGQLVEVQFMTGNVLQHQNCIRAALLADGSHQGSLFVGVAVAQIYVSVYYVRERAVNLGFDQLLEQVRVLVAACSR